jgi:hypothetical protein
MWYKDPNWWVQVAVAMGTFLVAFVALFCDFLKRRLFPPKLRLELKSNSGELTNLTLRDPVNDKITMVKGRYFHEETGRSSII